MTKNSKNGWSAYEKHVLSEIKDQKDTTTNIFKIMKGISRDLANFKTEVAKEIAQIKIEYARDITELRIKNSIWTVILSSLSAAIVVITGFFGAILMGVI